MRRTRGQAARRFLDLGGNLNCNKQTRRSTVITGKGRAEGDEYDECSSRSSVGILYAHVNCMAEGC